jgi:hypothetical protein
MSLLAAQGPSQRPITALPLHTMSSKPTILVTGGLGAWLE